MVATPKLCVITDSKENDFLQLLERFSIPFEVQPTSISKDQIERYASLAILADSYPELPTISNKLELLVDSFINANKPVFCEFLPIEGVVTREKITKPYTRLIARDIQSPLLNGFQPLDLFETHQNPFLSCNSSDRKSVV